MKSFAGYCPDVFRILLKSTRSTFRWIPPAPIRPQMVVKRKTHSSEREIKPLIVYVVVTVDRTAIKLRSSIAQCDMSLVAGLSIARIEQQRYRTVHEYTVTANTENPNLQLSS